MATVAKKVCDLCGSDDNVDELFAAYRFEESMPWGLDLCEPCYHEKFGAFVAKSHPVKRTTIRPQIRVVETVLEPEQLG